jgi:hypothetical protein
MLAGSVHGHAAEAERVRTRATDFTGSAAWKQASTEAQQENADGFRACIEE